MESSGAVRIRKRIEYIFHRSLSLHITKQVIGRTLQDALGLDHQRRATNQHRGQDSVITSSRVMACPQFRSLVRPKCGYAIDRVLRRRAPN